MSIQAIQLIVNSILTLSLPITIGFVCWFYRLFVQRMPEQQRLALEQFAILAVRRVEQEHKNAIEKRMLAYAIASDLFKAFKLPIPPEDALMTAIEAAVFDLPQKEPPL